MNLTPPSSTMSFPPRGFQISSELGESADEGAVGFAVAYSESNSSQRANLCCKSWFGLLLLRAGAGVLGVHATLALMQLEQGVLRSHLIFLL